VSVVKQVQQHFMTRFLKRDGFMGENTNSDSEVLCGILLSGAPVITQWLGAAGVGSDGKSAMTGVHGVRILSKH
jgi:hypothetical protein